MVPSRPGSARDRLVRAAAAVNVTRRVAASALILIIAAERGDLLRLDAGCADDLGPARDLGLDPRRRLLGRVAGRLIALLAELLDQLRRLERAVGLGIEARDHVARRSGRHREPV